MNHPTKLDRAPRRSNKFNVGLVGEASVLTNQKVKVFCPHS
jgi:hypothetical protein